MALRDWIGRLRGRGEQPAPGGAESGGAESGGAESGGAESGGAESGGAESGGAEGAEEAPPPPLRDGEAEAAPPPAEEPAGLAGRVAEPAPDEDRPAAPPSVLAAEADAPTARAPEAPPPSPSAAPLSLEPAAWSAPPEPPQDAPATDGSPEAPEPARTGFLGRLFRGDRAAPGAPATEQAPEAAREEAPEPPPEIAPPSEPEPASAETPEPAPAGGGWFSRLRQGLARSTQRLTDSVTTLFRKRRLDEEALEELEDTLITADLGVAAARRIVESFRSTRFGKEVTDEEVKTALAEQIAEILAPVASPMPVEPERAPHVVLVVGVNGTGKTTTIAKLGQQYREQGLACAFVAGDTFRAAAVEQLQIWGERTGCRVHAPQKPGADAAGLAYDALAAAREDGTQVLLVDTAGRLHNKSALMEELRKIIRVIRRLDPEAPHSVLLTLDATTGQNAIQQCKVFKEMVEVTGLAVTKLDGSAKGGVVVALAEEFGLPVHFVGVGETAQDLRPFDARDFARGLVGLA